jgi:hypothetical protein
MYRDSLDVGCQSCAKAQFRCAERGLRYPRAAPGYYLSPKRVQATESFTVAMIELCTPFEACTGTCPKEVQQAEQPDYEQCPGGIGGESCSTGYTGDRCSACTRYQKELTCSDTVINGYYRLDGQCEPCPCSIFTFKVIATLVVVFIIVIIILLDWIMQKVDHVSTIAAPVMIVITFCQTIALLLELAVKYPYNLRVLMQSLNVFNINLELARPECSIEFGMQQKMEFTLALPVIICLLVGVYALWKTFLASRMSLEEWKERHKGKLPRDYITEQCVTIIATAFVFLSIFFLRGIFNVFNCELDEINGRQFLKVDPTVECIFDDTIYFSVYVRAWIGMLMYMAMFGAFIYGCWAKRDLFAFLGDKFEDKWYYWELVLVGRKVGIMAAFLFYSATPAQSWLFGSMIITASLVLHAFARPYEDPLIDMCEFFSLVSTLFVALSAIVFAVLDDPNNPNKSEHARFMSSLCETVSIIAILMNCVFGMYIEGRVCYQVFHAEEDYKVVMIDANIATLERDLAQMKDVLKTATAQDRLKQDFREKLKRLKTTQNRELDLSNDIVDMDNPLNDIASPTFESIPSTKAKDGTSSQSPSASVEVEFGDIAPSASLEVEFGDIEMENPIFQDSNLDTEGEDPMVATTFDTENETVFDGENQKQ